MLDLPADLDDLPLDQRLPRSTPLIRVAAAWVRAIEEEWALEFEPDAAPTDMRETIDRVLAFATSADAHERPEVAGGLCEELLAHIERLVPEREPGAPDPLLALDGAALRAYLGLGILHWVLEAAQGVVRPDAREWLTEVLADPRLR